MALGTYLLGGLLQGIGRGQEMTILQARQDALENLRNQRQIESEDRAEKRTIASEGRAEVRQADRDERLFGQKRELLSDASEAKIGEINAKGSQDRRTRATDFNYDVQLEKVKSVLDTQRDAAAIRLKSELDTGSAWLEKTRSGEMVIIDREGNITPTGVKAPKENSSAADMEALGEWRRAKAAAEKRGQPVPSKADYGLADDDEEVDDPTKPSWYAPNAKPARVAKPKVGQVQDGYVFLGGNPADPKNWSKTR